jgi:hypothetical protein
MLLSLSTLHASCSSTSDPVTFYGPCPSCGNGGNLGTGGQTTGGSGGAGQAGVGNAGAGQGGGAEDGGPDSHCSNEAADAADGAAACDDASARDGDIE